MIALAILFFGIEYLKGVSIFKPSNYYYAVYTDAKGLTVSAPVNVNGFKIGQVDNVELMYDNPGHVLVEISLEKKFKLPVGSKAMIDSDLLGTASVKIEMANSNTFYEPGDTIVGSASAGLIDAVSQDLLPGISDMVPKIDSLLVSANKLVGNPALESALTRIDGITANINSTVGQLSASLSKLPTIMDDINSVTSSIKVIADDMTKLSNTIANAPIDSTIQNIHQISQQLSSLTERLNDPNSTIGQLTRDSGLYDNLTNAASNLDSLFVDIKRNPKRYINIKLL